MSYEGHCICGRIRVLLEQQPPSSLVCHWYVLLIYLYSSPYTDLPTVTIVVDRAVVSPQRSKKA